MRFSYDPEADALSLRLTDARIEDTDEVQPGIIIDYAEDGEIVAIEMLNVRKRSGQVDINIPSLNASVTVGKGVEQGSKGAGVEKGGGGSSLEGVIVGEWHTERTETVHDTASRTEMEMISGQTTTTSGTIRGTSSGYVTRNATETEGQEKSYTSGIQTGGHAYDDIPDMGGITGKVADAINEFHLVHHHDVSTNRKDETDKEN